jgi:hypothetical protein
MPNSRKLARLPFAAIALAILLASLAFCAAGCMSAYRQSVGGDPEQVYSRTYLTDINTAWQAVLQAFRASPLDITNRESGYIQTRWIDNTEQRNFADSFGGSDYLLKAQYRFRVNVAKTFYKGEPCAKVSVQKDQLVQIDVLEGWQHRESDSIEENTLLYRIGRIIYMQLKIAQAEDQKIKQEMKNSGMDMGAPADAAPTPGAGTGSSSGSGAGSSNEALPPPQ